MTARRRGVSRCDKDYGLRHGSHAAGRSAAHRSKRKRALTELRARRRPDAVSFAHTPIKVTTRQSAWLARCDPLFFLMPYRRGGRSLRGRTRRLVARIAQGGDVGDAHIAAPIRAGSAVPFIRCISRGSVPLARITRVFVRVDIGLRIGRRHADDHRQNAQPTDQSTLHHFTSLWTRTCHTFYW